LLDLPASESGSKQQNYIAFSCKDHGTDPGDVSPTLRSMGHDVSHANAGGQVAVAFSVRTANTSSNGWGIQEEISHTLDRTAGPAVATGVFLAGQGAKAGSIAYSEQVSLTLKSSDSGGNRAPTAHIGMQVRRLTPRECERLQGFPDDYTLILTRRNKAKETGENAQKLLTYYHLTGTGKKLAEMKDGRIIVTADGPRYKCLGNSWAVPVVRWIGRRIEKELQRNGVCG
jgi:DNA (cytosine-5)-methyltransferase 1